MIKKFFINEIKSFLGPPRQNYKIFILNLLGLQIIRYFFSYLKYSIFGSKKLSSFEAVKLDAEGYVVVKNFLINDEFKRIKYICDKIEIEKKYKIKQYGEKKVLSYDFFNNLDENDLLIQELKLIFIKNIQNSSFMNDIFRILKVKNKSIQNLSYEKIIVGNDFIDKGDSDAEFHADRFYPCIKMFFYLDNNSSENGAFEYIMKSHKFSLQRILHEYLYSVFICGNFFLSIIFKFFGYELKNNRVTFSKGLVEKKFGKNSIINCEAPFNTLVICNNKGFHRRGKFQQNSSRSHLRLNLYDLQITSSKNFLLNYAKKYKSKFLK